MICSWTILDPNMAKKLGKYEKSLSFQQSSHFENDIIPLMSHNKSKMSLSNRKPCQDFNQCKIFKA